MNKIWTNIQTAYCLCAKYVGLPVGEVLFETFMLVALSSLCANAVDARTSAIVLRAKINRGFGSIFEVRSKKPKDANATWRSYKIAMMDVLIIVGNYV